jgi:hypothetical protein
MPQLDTNGRHRDKRSRSKSLAYDVGSVWKAHHAARLSNEALSEWAEESGFKIVFLDAKSGNPRIGIVDAILLRIKPKSPD